MPLCAEFVNGDPCALEADHIVPCTPNVEDGWITLPTDPWTEILPGLWQGGTHHGVDVAHPTSDDFDAILTLYRSAPPAPVTVEERRFIFGDGSTIPVDYDEAVDWVYRRWAVQHKRVLVRCQAGLNRSGLIVAGVLVKTGRTPQEAIELIRAKRSPYALCNRFFVAHLTPDAIAEATATN